MKKKILSHTGFMIVLTAILTFIAASFLMYEKFDDVMKRTVRDETEYVKAGMEKAGEDYLSKSVGDNTGTRITLTDENGKVLYDSEADASKLPNHSNRPEFVQACTRLTDDNMDREVEGLLASMTSFSLAHGTIVTLDQHDKLTFGERTIDVVPFWDWALRPSMR